MLAPLVVVVTLALFAAIGLPLWRSNRLAAGTLWVGIVALIAIIVSWTSLPIALGGIAATLGVEAVRRGDPRRSARVGLVLGVLAAVAGAVLWLANV